MKKAEFIVLITGKSASGKDTVKNYLCENYKYNPVIAYTTRPMRLNESQGNPYYFLDNETFNGKDSMLKSNFNGWQYGYDWKDIDNTKFPVLVADNIQYWSICDNSVQVPITIYLERKDETRYIEQIKRGCPISEVYRRAIHDDASWELIRRQYNTHIIDNNGNIENTISKVLEAIADEVEAWR